MEHILQFGISIDDEAIKRKVEKSAIDEVAQDIKRQIFNMDRYDTSPRGLSYQTEELVKQIVAQYKDDIIERAAELVAESMKRSKKYKDALEKVTVEVIK